jgi:carboxypeptidase Taq
MVFAELKRELPALLQQVIDRQRPVGFDLAGSYPVAAQEGLSRRLMTCLGFDFSAGRLDVSLHPFSTGCRGDHRITTRFRETDFAGALMATAHETGHASYESGLPLAWEGLPAGRARSMSIHESQSLLFEKHLFLSRAFIGFFTEAIQDFLPDAKRFGAEEIWSAGVRVQPGLIRIEADELTYPLHVILRFEIEKALINQEVEAADIPGMWDEKMRAYLGVSTKGNHADGCLQDIHWTDGSFGYFPAYTLGALNAAQLFAAIRRQHPGWRERLVGGDVAFVRRWLEEKVWRHGCLKETREIMRDATGEETNPGAFLAHLRTRYIDRRD